MDEAVIRSSLPFALVQGRAPVSVVIPCYRCSRTIDAAVASICAQTLPPQEVVLVDDCSGDQTLDRLQDLAGWYPPGWIKVVGLRSNGGAACARNAGWRAATSDYIAFLDADDTWSPYKLQLQMAVLKADPSVALIAHRMQVCPRSARPPPLHYPVLTKILPRQRFLLHNPVPTASAVVRANLPFRFNEHFRRVEDYLLWAQIGLSGYRCAMINQVLASWHKPNYGVGGLSGDLGAMHKAGQEARVELCRQGLMSPVESCVCRTLSRCRRARRRVVMVGRRMAAHSSGLELQ
jgi:glycosyltransferase involved in cell wall biosynthesis